MKKTLDEIIIKEGIKELYRDKETPDGPWYKIGENLNQRDLTEAERVSLLQNSRQRYFQTSEARSLINNARNFIIGKGIVFTAKDENEAVQEALEEFWNHPSNCMELRQKEIVLRGLRDGEVFIRFFESADGVPLLRFVLPEQIKNIAKSENDAEEVIGYERKWTPAGSTDQKVENIPAYDIVHVKLGADVDMDRGRPYLECIMKRLVQLEQFIEGRIVRNRIASGYILEKVLKGKGATSAAVTSETGRMSDANNDVNVSTASKKMPKFGSVIVHNESIEYKWCNPEIRADDSKEDGRLIKLSICTGVNAPEYMLSDASNANYASTMVSENPYVRSCEDIQDTFEEYFKIIFRKVIERMIANGKIPQMSTQTITKERGILKGLLPKTKDNKVINKIRELLVEYQGKQAVRTSTEVQIEFPPMIHKELKADTEAYMIQNQMGWVSNRTISSKLGYNYDEEKQQNKNDREDNPDEQYNEDRKKEEEDKNGN